MKKHTELAKKLEINQNLPRLQLIGFVGMCDKQSPHHPDAELIHFNHH